MITMQQFRMSILAIGLAFAHIGSLSAADDAQSKSTDKASGTWKMVSRIVDGVETPKEELAGSQLILKNGTWKVLRAGEVIAEGTFKIVATENGVNTVATTNDKGEKAGKRSQHISKFEGNKLTICQAPAGKKCPTKFESKPGSGFTLTVWEREKP